jgi:pilus assembly protein CpaC
MSASTKFTMITLLALLAALAVAAQTAPAAAPATPAQPVTAPQAEPAGAQSVPAGAMPGQQVVNEQQIGAAPLRVMVGKSILINTADQLKRVSVTDPNVADALVVTPHQVLVQGRNPGEVSLIIWNQAEQSRSFDLRVDVDVTAVGEEIRRIFPEQQIQVSPSRSAIVLSGHVSTKEDAERASAVATAYSKNVINVLTFGPVGAQEILLEVKFAEVDRTALTQWGVNLFSTGGANTFGATGTQQFGPFSGSNIGNVTSDVQGTATAPGSHITTGEIGRGNFHNTGTFGTNDLLNIFLFRADINLGTIIRALQQKNILQILAEPNLIAVNGKEASFLAGGEFPFPVVQGGAGLQTVKIQFKEFGVRLKFTPVIMPNGNIHLQVNPEVSTLDFSNGISLSGFVVPALNTRRAATEFEIKDGQSFVIAGLMDNRVTNLGSKVPGLGNLPIIGNLFKSKNLTKSKTELMVLVTARRISPSSTPPTLVNFPEGFLDQKNPSPAGAKGAPHGGGK